MIILLLLIHYLAVYADKKVDISECKFVSHLTYSADESNAIQGGNIIYWENRPESNGFNCKVFDVTQT